MTATIGRLGATRGRWRSVSGGARHESRRHSAATPDHGVGAEDNPDRGIRRIAVVGPGRILPPVTGPGYVAEGPATTPVVSVGITPGTVNAGGVVERRVPAQ